MSPRDVKAMSDPKVPYVNPETAAMLRERERCAKIAEARATENPGEYTGQFSFKDICQQIADRIRSGK